MYDTDGIENTNNNKTKHQNNRGLKIVAAVFLFSDNYQFMWTDVCEQFFFWASK